MYRYFSPSRSALLATSPVLAQGKQRSLNERTLLERIKFGIALSQYDPFQTADAPTSKWIYDPASGVDVAVRDKPWPQNQWHFNRGEAFTLTITGTPGKGYHTYPFTRRTANQEESGLNQIKFEPIDGVNKVGALYERDPHFAKEETSGIVLEHKDFFEISQDFIIGPTTSLGEKILRFEIRLQVCDEHNCLPGVLKFAVPFVVVPEPIEAPGVNTIAVLPPAAVRGGGDKPIEVVPIPDSVRNVLGTDPVSASAPQEGALSGTDNVWILIFTTMGYALVMLFTPCVFPMIPVTVSFFLHQAEKKHGSAVPLALVYSGTIVGLLTLAVLSLGSVIIALASQVWLNLAFGLLLMTFALSLFGMFEIELPSFLTRFTSAHEGKGGLIGAFFMALTFTITSFTCTGPLLGVVLAPAAQASFGFAKLLLIALSYSITFAAPFFLLALFPGMLKQLPKSGGWLNAVKVVMGFLEVAFAFKFLGIADAGLFPGNPRLFTYDTVLCAWMALSVACGLYLLGFIRLPNDTPLSSVGVPRLMMAILLFALTIYMAPALWKQNPKGMVGEFIVSYLPKDAGDEGWYLDYDVAREKAIKENKPLFIDFTGVNCQNCRWNELNVFSLPAVKDELKNYVLVRIYTDIVPDPKLAAAAAFEKGDRNREIQGKTFGSVVLPLYVVFVPDRDKAEVDGTLQGKELARHEGIINNATAFVQKVLKSR